MVNISSPFRRLNRRWNKNNDLRMDVEEWLTLLPRCRSRPTVYNEFARHVQKLRTELQTKSADFQDDDKTDVTEFDVEMPALDRPNSLYELQRDADLLQLLAPMRYHVKTVVNSYKQQILADIRTYYSIQKEKTQRMILQRQRDAFALQNVLSKVHRCPYIYNQVLVKVQQTLPYNSKRRLSSLRHQQQQLMRWKKPDPPTSQQRWEEVRLLDELLDDIPDDCAFVRDFLVELKCKCRSEAKILCEAEVKESAC